MVPEGRVRRATRWSRTCASGCPRWYADHGFVDFQVTARLADRRQRRRQGDPPPHGGRGPAVSGGHVRHRGEPPVLERGAAWRSIPFGPVGPERRRRWAAAPFSRSQWDAATEKVQNLYANNGYIYAQVEPEEIRRTGARRQAGRRSALDHPGGLARDDQQDRDRGERRDPRAGDPRGDRDAAGRPVQPGPPDPLVPERLQPRTSSSSRCRAPDVKPSANGVDVDIVFRVEEKRTGNINFGASLGQGTGVGGFLGLEEPNLFGRGKRGKLQWQFGKNINDFTLSYTDPGHPGEPDLGHGLALRLPRPVHRGRSRPPEADRRQRSSSASRSSARATPGSSPRTPTSGSRYSEGSADLRARFSCTTCSPLDPRRQRAPGYPGRPAVRHRRLAHQRQRRAERRVPGRDRQLPEGGPGRALVRPPGHHGRRRAARRRGTVRARTHRQVGLHLRRRRARSSPSCTRWAGCSTASRSAATTSSPSRRTGSTRRRAATRRARTRSAKSFAAFTVEAGRADQPVDLRQHVLRRRQRLPRARQWDPTRLFRGAGFGAAVISPLGPIGVDLGYGFDRVDGRGRPDPGWQLHFKLGNFF